MRPLQDLATRHKLLCWMAHLDTKRNQLLDGHHLFMFLCFAARILYHVTKLRKKAHLSKLRQLCLRVSVHEI